MNEIEFWIPGVPAPGGSKKAFPLFRKGLSGEKVFVRSMIVDDAGQRNKDWKNNAGWSGKETMLRERLPLFRGALDVRFDFIMPRLKSHFTSKGGLRPAAPKYHVKKPDLSKIIRSTEDGLTSIVWADDAQISIQSGTKVYGDAPGCRVTIRELEEMPDAAVRGSPDRSLPGIPDTVR